MSKANYAVVAYPYSLGARVTSAMNGPLTLLELGLLEHINAEFIGQAFMPEAAEKPDARLPKIVDSNFPEVALRNLTPTISALTKTVSNLLKAYDKGLKPVLVGGDHSQLIASSLALAMRGSGFVPTASAIEEALAGMFGNREVYKAHFKDSKASRCFRAMCLENEDLEVYIGPDAALDEPELKIRLDALEMTEMVEEYKNISYTNDLSGIGILQIDAHADCNTPLTSPTGNIHGMTIAALAGLLNPGRGGLIRPSNIVFIGTRSLEMGELSILQALGMKIFSMEHVSRSGLPKTFQAAKEYLAANGVDKCILSIDVDGFDPDSGAHATGAPVKDGISTTEGFRALQACLLDPFFAGADLTEYHPTLDDPSKTTGHFIIKLLKSITNKPYAGYI